MNKALIVVDYQNDFLPGGALAVEDGHRAYRPLRELMDDVDIIVFTRDWHPADHMSFYERGLPNRMVNEAMEAGLWPPHCVQGTFGAEIDDALWDEALDTGKPVILVHKGFDRNKEAYSGFEGVVVDVFNDDLLRDALISPEDGPGEGTTLAQVLYYLNTRVIKIGGLALDYCVKATAIDARSHVGNTTVFLDATRPVAYLSGASAVGKLAASGVNLNDWSPGG